MNPYLEEKINQLDQLENFDCWYLVKQNADFRLQCYLVSMLKDYQEHYSSYGLEDWFKQKGNQLVTEGHLNSVPNYRALRIAAFYGLIIMNDGQFKNAKITEVYYEITERCKGEYNNIELYQDILERQIEKMYLSSEIDEKVDSVRKNIRLYPVMLLYKVLIELGITTGKFEINIEEFRYFVTTTPRFEDYLDAVLLIKLYRNDDSASRQFSIYRDKLDNRVNKAIEQLPTLNISGNLIAIKQERLKDVYEKLAKFEQNPNSYKKKAYIPFLASTDPLVDVSSTTQPFESQTSQFGYNKIYYGIPGCGKSYYVENTVLKDADKEDNVFRTTFYLDYSNSDFIGQIYPVVKKGTDNNEYVTYERIPGPFTLALERALKKPKEMVYLVIEEINRGNAAAIFGDIFQLLDRVKESNKDKYPNKAVGESEYPIHNEFITSYINSNKDEDQQEIKRVYIPSNLSIIATMNTSDQNVFPLDTAFKRRWSRERVIAKWEEVSFKDMYIPFTDYTWEQFAKSVNKRILDLNDEGLSYEDKQLGPYFITSEYLVEKKLKDEVNDENIARLEGFVNNVIDYLYNDVTKFQHASFFDSKYVNYDSVYEAILAYPTMDDSSGKNFCIKGIQPTLTVFVEDMAISIQGDSEETDD